MQRVHCLALHRIKRRSDYGSCISNIEVRVENLLARFTPTPRVDLEEAVERLGGVVNGDVIIKMLDRPRATLIIDSEGRIVVHGTHRIEAARAA